MKAYDLYTRCVKCGSRYAEVWINGVHHVEKHRTRCVEYATGASCMERICVRCGHMWHEAPLDIAEEAKP